MIPRFAYWLLGFAMGLCVTLLTGCEMASYIHERHKPVVVPIETEWKG